MTRQNACGIIQKLAECNGVSSLLLASKHFVLIAHTSFKRTMSTWVRILVVVPFLLFIAVAILIIIDGDGKAALGALLLAGLIAPLLLEVIWPGRYVLRKPDGEVEDNFFNRLKQFRVDYPGRDGTFFLGVFALIGVGLLAGGVARLFG